MFSAALVKPILGIGVVGAVALTAGGLSMFSKSKPNTVNQSSTIVNEHSPEEISESITPIVRVKPKYNFAVMYEGISSISYGPNNGQQKIKCKLEDSTEAKDYCAISKLPLTNQKKWIDLREYGTASINSIIDTNYITEEKTIYKVRVIGGIIDAWLKEPTKNLQIFKDASDEAANTPLITLTPKLGIKNNNKFKGKMQYVVGRVSGFNANSQTKYDVSNNWLSCALPGAGDVYKNCEMMLFDNDENSANPQDWAQKNLKTPLTKAKEIKKHFHYLIRFNEETAINDGRYGQNETLKVKIYSNWNRSSVVAGEIKEIHLQELSPVVIFEDHLGIDLAFVL